MDVAGFDCRSRLAAGTVLAVGQGCSAVTGIGCVGRTVARVRGRSRCVPDPAAVAVLGWRNRMRLVERETDILLRLAFPARHIDPLVSYSAPVEEVVALVCCSLMADLVVVALRCYYSGWCAASALPVRVRRVWKR